MQPFQDSSGILDDADALRARMAFEMPARGDGRAKSALQRIVSSGSDGDKRARARAALEALEADAA